ncbi:MAG: YjjG family noncanonical pyrimidine nucleotidase [Lachnospiraceae bacterium]|nr:YjjG family noncanonical pyrimidine nucleotidase [Lachnospiraceae bacterium]
MGKFTTILWDLDQTLLNFDLSMEHALRAVFDQYGLPVNEAVTARYDAINKSYWLRLETGELTKEQVTVGRFRTLFEELGITHVTPEKTNADFQRELGNVFFYIDGAKELVILLKERGYRQYVVTNGVNTTQASKMKLSGLDRLMDGVFVSELMGYPKPRKEYFDACFAALPDVTREECILVGDSLTSDMRGAENAGVASCWFNPEGRAKDVEVRTDYEIRRLEELLQILE